MVGILILTQGGLAEELLTSARNISGDLVGFEALSLGWHESCEDASYKVGLVLPRLDTGQGVLILTDMYGSTPTNVASRFLEAGRVEILTGVNLPMVVRLGCLVTKDMTLGEMADWLCDKGRSSIRCGVLPANNHDKKTDRGSKDCEGV